MDVTVRAASELNRNDLLHSSRHTNNHSEANSRSRNHQKLAAMQLTGRSNHAYMLGGEAEGGRASTHTENIKEKTPAGPSIEGHKAAEDFLSPVSWFLSLNEIILQP